MKRPFLFAPAALLAIVAATGCSSAEDDAAEGDDSAFSSNQATLLDFEFDGEILEFEPPALLAIRWGTDLLRFELQRDGDATVLTLTDTFDELGKAARDGAGWHECHDYLELELAGAKPDFKPGERWAAVHPQYVAAFGPEASSIGPPTT